MSVPSLTSTIVSLLEELAALSAIFNGPDDLAALFTDLDDYPELDAHPDTNYAIAYVAGAAAALGMTTLALLDELGVELDREQLLARREAVPRAS